MLELIKKASHIYEKRQKRMIAFLMCISILGAVIDALTVALIYPLMESLLGVSASGENSTLHKLFSFIPYTHQNQTIVLLGILSVLYLLAGIWKIVQQTIVSYNLANIRVQVSARTFCAILDKPYSYHLQHSTAETHRLVTEDCTRCNALLTTTLELVNCFVSAVGVIVTLFLLQPELTLVICLIALLAILFLNRWSARAAQKLSQKNQKYLTLTNRWVFQAIGALKSVLVNKKEQMFLNQYAINAKEAGWQDAKHEILSSVPKFALEYGGMSAIFFFVTLYVSTNKNILSIIPTIGTFAMAAVKLFPYISVVLKDFTAINYRKASVDVLYDILREDERTETEIVRPMRKTVVSESLRHGIKVDHLSFCFDDATTPLFVDLSVQIPANRSVAFIGTTGSGKTTLADLILGLHSPSGGRILVDGKDISTIREWWADQIGYIPQFIYLCDDTIKANVAFGCDPEEIEDENVWHAIRDAQLEDFVHTLPEGLNTIVGENGIRLSGGQRQRIGIARALYQNPSFIVMDEATSALDQETEAAVMESIKMLSGRKTMLIIAHRLTTTRDCDIVYRIENGTAIVERGEENIQ